MLTDWARRTFRVIIEPLARQLQRLGISPNLLTLVGLGLQALVGLLLASGQLVLGGVLLIIFAAFDALDGTLARLSGQVTKFGSFLDSTVDRYAEALILFGLLWHAYRQGNWEQALLIYAAIVGSLLVSYTRAKAESLGIECKVGIMTRAERVTLLVIGLVFSGWQPMPRLPDGLTIALWVLAVFSNITALQRAWAVRRATTAEQVRHE